MKLPSVYANKIDKKINNNDEYYYNNNVREFVEVKDLKELKRYFDKNGYANKLVVKLYYRDNKNSVEKLILCRDDYFVNIDNKRIYHNDIINYEIQ